MPVILKGIKLTIGGVTFTHRRNINFEQWGLALHSQLNYQIIIHQLMGSLRHLGGFFFVNSVKYATLLKVCFSRERPLVTSSYLHSSVPTQPRYRL